MRFKILFLIVFLALNSNAQNYKHFKNVEKELKDSFSSIEKNRVPTGFLSDYSLELVSFKDYSGAMTDSNYVSFETLNLLSQVMQDASLSGKVVKQFSSCIPSMSKKFRNNYLPVGIIAYKYNSIREDALKKGLINYDGATVSDRYVNGRWINPYDNNTVLGFSPYVNTVTKGQVIFSFRDEWLSSNIEETLELEFDPGDGYGYRSVKNGSNIKVNYGTGQHEIKMRLSFSSEEGRFVKESHSYLMVLGDSSFNRNPVSATISSMSKEFVSSIAYGNGVIPSASISIAYAKGRSCLKKPFLVVEGFDPLAGIDGYETSINTFMDSVSESDFNIVDYDVVYVDWNDSFAPIQVNADILQKIIVWVRNNTDENGEKCVIMAESMGGLIARYALCEMEKKGELHNVSHFISVDSPFLGVNVPLGAVYGAQHLFEALDDADESYLIDVLLGLTGNYTIANTTYNSMRRWRDAPSIRQMLCNYVNKDYEIDNSLFNELQATFSDIGFPKGDDGKSMIRLAISNGGEHSMNGIKNLLSISANGSISYLSSVIADVLFLPGLLLRALDLKMLGAVGLLPGKTSMLFDCNIYPYSSSDCLVYKDCLRYRKKGIFWRKTVKVYEHSDYSPKTGVPMDYVSGSLYDIDKLGLSSEGGLDLLYNYSLSISHADKIVFVPTVSSVCYRDGFLVNSDYFDSHLYSKLNRKTTPFDDVYLNSIASSHVYISDNMWCWLGRMLELYKDGPDMGLKIYGPTLLNDVATYEVVTDRTVPYNYSVEWSSSNTDVLSVNSQTGEASFLKKGISEMSAKVKVKGSEIILRKQIQAGLPDYAIMFDQSFVNAKEQSYAVARSVQGVLPEIQKDISFQWGLAGNLGDISWGEVTNNNRYNFTTAPQNNQRVYLRVLYKGVVYQTLSVICFYYPDTIIVTSSYKLPGLIPSFKLLIPDISVSSSLQLDDSDSYAISILGFMHSFDHLPTVREALEPDKRDGDAIEYATALSNALKPLQNKNKKENVFIDYKLINRNTGTSVSGTFRFIWKDNIDDILNH